MISENLDGKRGTMKVMSPGFEGMDYCQEFAVIDIVVAFRQREGLRKVGTGVPFTIRVSLEEDSTQCVFRCVSGNSKGRGEVWHMKDWLWEKEVFEVVEGLLLGGGPIPG